MSGGRPEKRSLTIRGHRTSVSLEAAFWAAFREIAEAEGKALNALAAEIDAGRSEGTNLASAIRLHVLAWWRRPGAAGDPGPGPAGGRAPQTQSG